jgi:hypothetical protein
MKLIIKSVLLLGVVFVFSGCANGYGYNSVDKYVAKEIKKYSGLTPNPVNDPAYRLAYSSEIDEDCVVIRIEGDYIESMKSMLREMLGEPNVYEDVVKYKLPNGVYLYCWPGWDWRDKSHRWVNIRINPPLR